MKINSRIELEEPEPIEKYSVVDLRNYLFKHGQEFLPITESTRWKVYNLLKDYCQLNNRPLSMGAYEWRCINIREAAKIDSFD